MPMYKEILNFCSPVLSSVGRYIAYYM